MSTNRSRSRNSMTIPPEFAMYPARVGEMLARGNYIFILDPSKSDQPQSVKPGIHSFVQEKRDPQTVCLMHLQSYASSHNWLREKFQLKPEDLLSAGEMLLDHEGKPLAFSFQTGQFFETLKLADPTEERLKEFKLPREKFFLFEEWQLLSETCFQLFFTLHGKYNIIEKKEETSEESIKAAQAERTQIEAAVFEKITNERIKNIFLQIQNSRDIVEQQAFLQPAKTSRSNSVSRESSVSRTDSLNNAYGSQEFQAGSLGRSLSTTSIGSAVSDTLTPNSSSGQLSSLALTPQRYHRRSLTILPPAGGLERIESENLSAKATSASPVQLQIHNLDESPPADSTKLPDASQGVRQSSDSQKPRTPSTVSFWAQGETSAFFGKKPESPAKQHQATEEDATQGCCFSFKKLFSKKSLKKYEAQPNAETITLGRRK